MGKKYSLIYIAGYGRSGSTLLEKILTAHDNLFGFGELSYLPEEVLDDRSACSCGELLAACPFWQPILTAVPEQTGETWESLHQLQRNMEAWSLWKGRKPSAGGNGNQQERYQTYTRTLYQQLAEAVPASEPVLVDSSKTSYTAVYKPLNLADMNLARLKVIHLVRDLRGVMWSMASRGLNRDHGRKDMKRAFIAEPRAIAGWVYANRGADRIAGRIASEDYTLLRYEDLVADPAAVLKELGAFLEIDLSAVIEVLLAGELISQNHQVAGNRMKLNKALRLKPDIVWPQNLSASKQWLANVLAGRDLKRYKYR